MTTEPSLVVLAGGRSTRFGTEDKALAPLAGRPMLAHVVETLRPAVGPVVVNCRRDQRAAFDEAVGDRVRFAVDPVPDAGPVDGLRTGLRTVPTEYSLVVGCDMPRFDAPLAGRLREAAAGESGAAPVLDGRPEPLGVVYRVDDALEAVERTLARGDSRLGEVLARVDPVGVPAPPGALRDVNTPAALAALQTEGTLVLNPEQTNAD